MTKMLECKAFEILDRMTFIPAVAVYMTPANLGEIGFVFNPCPEHESKIATRYLLRRAGYSEDHAMVMLIKLINGDSQLMPFLWGGRTMPTAHEYIVDHWDELQSGAVVDVEFILGETGQPKQSERSEQ